MEIRGCVMQGEAEPVDFRPEKLALCLSYCVTLQVS